MSHLICSDHKRRVMVIDGRTYHRSDGSKCPTKTVRAGKNEIPVGALVEVKVINIEKES